MEEKKACDCYNPTPPSQVSKPPPPPPTVKPTPAPPVVKPPPPPPPPTEQQTGPIDALKLGACVDVLGGLIHIGLGHSAKEKCCPLLQGLADLDAAICLCTAIRVNALKLINLLVPISLQVLVSTTVANIRQQDLSVLPNNW
ncbi:hypothetical protein CICLE_v10013358mg [Citrus x clementina]|uniref:Hydrophobic seed protein domain-containing protein n=1 Tax=Citrus clementina TaxID=85681 RepID=V4SQP9_CITCL|nr:hypothetical protein CICLE_v10013358mg [Citrus x clementina]